MSYLFVDSTYDITLGILDDDFSWIDYKKYTEKKASTVLQTEMFHMLTEHGFKVKDVKALVTIAGPGFYTGLRLSEGLADVFKFFGIPHYSFYSYEIPFWCGQEEGVWFTKAYRGEYFLHEWRSGVVKSELIPTKDLESQLKNLIDPLYIHSKSSLDAFSLNVIHSPIATWDLLENSPGVIFSKVIIEKRFRDSFYFRAPEDEFKVNP